MRHAMLYSHEEISISELENRAGEAVLNLRYKTFLEMQENDQREQVMTNII